MIPQDDHGNIVAATYRVNVQDPYLYQFLPNLVREVRFRNVTTSEGKNIPAPSPKLLEIHAACAQIAHMSGAAEYLGEFFRDTDTIAVMTHPHAADELSRVLGNLQVIPATRGVC